MLLLLLSCWIIAGVMAEDPARTYYRATNSPVCLHVTKPPRYVTSLWTFGDDVIVSNSIINPHYQERVDYNHENITLCIKKLTKTNTGTYTVSILDKNFTRTEEKHRVNVQDAVPRPVSVVSVLRSNASTGFCSFTVNCSVWGHWLWSTCDKDGCRPSRRPSGEVNVTVSVSNGTVVCRGNNHVSTNHVSENMATTCFTKSDPEITEAARTDFVQYIIFVACAFLVVFVLFMAKKLFSKFKNQLEVQPQPEPRRPHSSTSSSSPSDAGYENIDDVNPVQGSGSRPSQDVTTVYSVFPEPIHGGENGKGTNVKRTGGATAPQSVDVAETHICTVYSELQMPQNLKPQHHRQDVKGT